MRHLITTLLTTALVLVTSVVFSQSDPDFCGHQSSNISSKELIHNATESAYRIKARRDFRQAQNEILKEQEKNKLPYQKTFLLDEPFDFPICVPVVFNIIHNGAELGTQWNPSNENILELLGLLNDQFQENSGLSEDTGQPYTGFSFTLGAEGTVETAIRRFDRFDESIESIVYGSSATTADDWPEFSCEPNYNYGQLSPNTYRYVSRTAYNPTENLNVYLIPIQNPSVKGFSYSPNDQVVPNLDPLGDWGNLGVRANIGVILNSGACDLVNGALPIFGSDGDYSQMSGTNGDDVLLQNTFKMLIAHEVGHFLGLHHTWDPPSDAVCQDVIGMEEPDNFYEYWCEVIALGEFQLDGQNLSYCELHGDYVCDTKWSSQIFAPLNLLLGLNQCGEDPSTYQSYQDPEGCGLVVYEQHKINESTLRRNVMNTAQPACDHYDFTEGQIERMHDMTLLYRQDLIAQGGLMGCLFNADGEPGCMDPIACNYDWTAVVSDGSCTYDCCWDCIYDFNQDGLISVYEIVQFLQTVGTDCPE